MRLVKLNVRKGIIKAIVKSYSDLISLQYILDKEDEIIAYSHRKITIGKSQEVKTIKIGLEIDKVDLDETSLNVSGRIVYSSDENVPLHKYHTITLKIGTGFVLKKQKMMNFQVKILRQTVESAPKVFICVYEMGYAIFYSMSDYRIKKKMELRKNVSGKRFNNESRKVFLSNLSGLLQKEYKKKYSVFIVAGKAIENEELRREYLNGINVEYETISYADTGLRELLSKDSINSALSKARLSVQRSLMEEYLSGISRNDPRYIYGDEHIKESLVVNQPIQAIVSKDYILKNRETMEKLDLAGCSIALFDENDDSLAQLVNFGGIIVKFTSD